MMAKRRPRKPGWPYSVIDADGHAATECATLNEARAECVQNDHDLSQCAPHRIYVLVSLEERRIIQAAKRLVANATRSGDATANESEQLWCALEKAVEASRG